MVYNNEFRRIRKTEQASLKQDLYLKLMLVEQQSNAFLSGSK